MENKLTAIELRIGNYYNHNGEIGQVTPNTILEVWEAEREWCKPIPLNEEWLLKFGFIKEYKWYYKNGLRLTLIGDLYFRGNFPIKADIKYVHSLQNLYFALTNEELAIK